MLYESAETLPYIRIIFGGTYFGYYFRKTVLTLQETFWQQVKEFLYMELQCQWILFEENPTHVRKQHLKSYLQKWQIATICFIRF